MTILFAAGDDNPQLFAAPGLPELRVAALQEQDARTRRPPGWAKGQPSKRSSGCWQNANRNPLALIELPQALTVGQASGREPLTGALPPATSVERS